MPLKHGIDDQILRVTDGQQTVGILIGPINRQSPGERDKPVLKRIVGVVHNQAIAHARPGKIVHPCGMRVEELGCTRRHPFGEPVVVLLRGVDLPAHEDEHDVEHGDLLGEGGDIREGAQDVGEDFGDRVRVDASLRVEEGRNAGVGWADEALFRDALGCFALAVVEEIEEDGVEGACWGHVADGR